MEYMQSVVANYSAAELPLETIWSDIDYMHNRFRNAEFDPLRYPVNQMSAFVEELHANGQHWVPILDAGVAAAPGYTAFEEGTKDNIWIRDYTGEETFVGQVSHSRCWTKSSIVLPSCAADSTLSTAVPAPALAGAVQLLC